MSFGLRAFLVVFLLGAVAVPAPAAELAPAKPDPTERMRALAERWESGELTAAEKDELIRSFIVESLRAGPPGRQASPPAAAPTSELLPTKVIAVYPDRNTTKLVIESRQPLISGTLMYAGPRELQVTLGDLLARSGDLAYYSASTPGKAPIKEGDAVIPRQRRVLDTPSPLRLKIEETYTFEQKRFGEVTAVQDGRAMIDRGTLHEVRERDLYKVLDSSGATKGFLEIRGIGDLQSSGVLYNRMEDRRPRALSTAPGDRTVFIGQRKLMALGFLGGFSPIRREEFGKKEKTEGLGLAWDLMFKNGWGVELLFGAYQRVMYAGKLLVEHTPPAREVTSLEKFDMKVIYYAPFVVKKNFFFPSTVSPFVLLGGSVVESSISFHHQHVNPNIFPNSTLVDQTWTDSATTVAPVFGGGVDFFPARLIRPRFDVRWFAGPTLHAGRKHLNTEMLTLSFSLFSAW